MKDYSHFLFRYVHQFAQADEIVIAAPYWDLSFPAVLKNYLENVSVAGITFRYCDNGIPTGLCKAKNLYYVTTAGGYMGENNFGFSYIKALAGKMFGIKMYSVSVRKVWTFPMAPYENQCKKQSKQFPLSTYLRDDWNRKK